MNNMAAAALATALLPDVQVDV